MDSHSDRSPSEGGRIWPAVFLLSASLLAALAVFLLGRERQSQVLLIALGVAVVFLGLERGATAGETKSRQQSDPLRHLILAMALVAGAAFAIYFPTLRSYFLADDFGYVRLYRHPSFGYFLRLLTMDQSQGIWGYPAQEFRPLGGASYMVDFLFSGTNPVGYHLTAVLLHVLSALAIFGIARKAANVGVWGAALAGLLFAFLPVHSESVAWINGSKVDALPSMFYLVGFLGFVYFRATPLTRYAVLCALGFLGSLLSKEIAVTFPAMLVCYDLFRWSGKTKETSSDREAVNLRWRQFLLPYLPIAALFGTYLVARSAIFASVLREEQWVFNTREAFVSLAGFRSQSGRLWTAFADLHQFNFEQFLLGFPPWTVGIAMGLTLAWTVFMARVNARGAMLWVLYFGAVWYGIVCLPLLITYHSARHLYLPVAGPCIALACLAAPGRTRWRRRAQVARVAGSVALLCILAVLLWRQNRNWVRAGAMSEKLEKEFIAAVEATPREALVIAWAPFDYNKAYVWAWVLPYALQEPFVSRDLYSEVRMVEFPDMFCCPVEQWWERKRPVLLSILAGDPEAPVEVHRIAWDGQRGAVGRLRVSLSRKQLRALIEGVLDGPLENAQTIPYDTAIKLMTAFMDLTAPAQ